MRPLRVTILVLSFVIAVMISVGCGSSASSSGGSPTGSGTGGAGSTTAASDATSAATGDIPDNQVFLTFHNSKAGYSIQYPEGWTQMGNGDDVTFSDKGNTVHISVASGPPATVSSAKAGLIRTGRGDPSFQTGSPAPISLKNGPAIKVTYPLQGPPDPVTGKREPLVVDRYVYSHAGKVATVDLGTVKGVDNVDAYRLISNSFAWG